VISHESPLLISSLELSFRQASWEYFLFFYKIDEEREEGCLKRVFDCGDPVTRMDPYHACQAFNIYLVPGLQLPLCPYPSV